jgi:hypothetical protein
MSSERASRGGSGTTQLGSIFVSSSRMARIERLRVMVITVQMMLRIQR